MVHLVIDKTSFIRSVLFIICRFERPCWSLHGLANQNNLKFVLDIIEHYNGVPSDEQLKESSWDRLNSAVIPGYGHAVEMSRSKIYCLYEFR